MPETRVIYLQKGEAERFEAGRFRFVSLLCEAVSKLGYRPVVRDADALTSLLGEAVPGPALWHQMRPGGTGGLVFRTAYRPPFWRIERSHARWLWEVAQQDFSPERIDMQEARAFCDRMRSEWRIEKRQAGASDIVIALQADLLRKRSFQSVSPIDMLKREVESSDGRRCIAALHPRANYSSREAAALNAVSEAHGNLMVQKGDTESLLPGAARLVTQNSTVAVAAYLAHVPVTLYAKADFHHIATQDDAAPKDAAHDFDRYVFWLLTTSTIRAGKPDVVDQIARRLTALGF